MHTATHVSTTVATGIYWTCQARTVPALGRHRCHLHDQARGSSVG
jgi:hypothetical protein